MLRAATSIVNSAKLKKLFKVTLVSLFLVSPTKLPSNRHLYWQTKTHWDRRKMQPLLYTNPILIFQIILIYGNYMNSSRRGLAYGFKLESLSKVRFELDFHGHLCELQDTRLLLKQGFWKIVLALLNHIDADHLLLPVGRHANDRQKTDFSRLHCGYCA